jgi:hypothetical protein
VRVVISGSDPPPPDAGALEFAGVALDEAAGARADEAASDPVSSCVAVVGLLAAAASPPADPGVFGKGAAGGSVACEAVGGCAAVPDEVVGFGGGGFPWEAGSGAPGEPLPPCDALAGGAPCAGGVAGLGFFSSEGL